MVIQNDRCRRVLVTGGAGFIGSHLCDALVEAGQEVICLDNFFTGQKDNIRHLLHHPRFELIRHDITNPIVLQVDQIYNLACPAAPIHYQVDPLKTTKTSFMGTLNCIQMALEVKARLLLTSTSEVYGDPQVHPQTEGYWGNVNPVGPRSCYDEGKRAAETLMFDARRQYNLDTKVVRIFNTYGPRMALNDGRVISNFVVQALRGEDITVYGDGSQTRSFCYITDLTAGLISMMNREDFIGPVNLGNPEEFTIHQLAERIIEKTGSSSQIVFQERPQDDPAQRRPDITLAGERLRWKPEIPLDVGIQETIRYFEKKLLSHGII